MKIYNVGVDELSEEYDLKNLVGDGSGYRWLVYWYESGYYDGGGEAIAFGEDGKLHYANLGHCSCYGPGDGGFSDTFAVMDILKEEDEVRSRFERTEVEKKVLYLLKRNRRRV